MKGILIVAFVVTIAVFSAQSANGDDSAPVSSNERRPQDNDHSDHHGRSDSSASSSSEEIYGGLKGFEDPFPFEESSSESQQSKSHEQRDSSQDSRNSNKGRYGIKFGFSIEDSDEQ